MKMRSRRADGGSTPRNAPKPRDTGGQAVCWGVRFVALKKTYGKEPREKKEGNHPPTPGTTLHASSTFLPSYMYWLPFLSFVFRRHEALASKKRLTAATCGGSEVPGLRHLDIPVGRASRGQHSVRFLRLPALCRPLAPCHTRLRTHPFIFSARTPRPPCCSQGDGAAMHELRAQRVHRRGQKRPDAQLRPQWPGRLLHLR